MLSVYYYEKKHEEKRFFDAWWQFSHTVKYFLLGGCLAIYNIANGLFKLQYNPNIYIIIVLAFIVFDFTTDKYIREKYEGLVIEETKKISPCPVWGLYIVTGISILMLLYSFTFIPRKI